MSLEEKESEDVRLDYIGSITTSVMTIDAGLWAELIWKEDNVLIIKDFLDTPNTRLLLVYVDSKDKLLVTTEFPSRRPFSKECVYFLKNKDVAIPMIGFRQHFMHGTLSHCPLQQYQALFEQVLMPIFCSPKNNTKWPVDVSKDITLHFQDFRKTLYYSVGQASGKTILPIPETAKEIDVLNIEEVDKESMGNSNIRTVIDSIGDMVLDWTTLINEVMETGCSGDPLNAVDHQGPLSEIIFWKARKENLQFIFRQINEPLVKKMALVLQKVDSCYSHAFMKLLRNMVDALSEADDIANNLQDLAKPFHKLRDSKFSEIKKFIPELMDTVTRSWTNSKYFSTVPSRIGVLVKKICNQLIVKAREFLDGPNLFHKERELSETEIQEAKLTLDSFIESYSDCRENMESTFEHAKLYPWEFSDERVFSRLNKFIDRLNNIQDLFDAADTFKQIPKFEIRGLLQMELKCRLNNIFEEFFQQYKVFEESNCDILDLDVEIFEENYKQFQAKIRDLDCRLGAAISQGCIQSSPTIEAFELMEMFSSLIKRPLVEIEFKNCVPNLLMNIRRELVLAKEMYNNNMKFTADKGFCIVYKNVPAVAGGLLWASELKEKLSKPMDAIEEIKKYFVTENDAEAEYQMYHELIDLLTKYQKDIFLDWVNDTDSVIGTMMDQSLLLEDSDGQFIVNYNMRMSEIIEEVKLLLKIELESIPEKALSLNDQYSMLRYVRSLLISTVSWYNTLCKELVPFEKELIAKHWDEINGLLEKGRTLTWNSSGVEEYAEEVFDLTKVVYEDVCKTKENINDIKKMIETWNQRPIYARKTPTALIDLKIYMWSTVRQQYNNVKSACVKMQEKMEENLQLFKCDANSQEWVDYVKFLETIIEDGLKECTIYNLQYLFDNTDATNAKLTPYTKVCLELDPEEGLMFVPPMMGKQAGSLLHCFESAIDKIYEMAEQSPRMTNEEETYVNALNDCEKLSALKLGIIQHVMRGNESVMDCIEEFYNYEDLWLVSIEEALEDFLLYGPEQPYEEEEEEEETEIGETEQAFTEAPTLEEKPPTEEEFRQQISEFELLQRKAEDIQPTITAENWLIVDTTSFKEGLLLTIRKWITTYKEKLIEQKSLGKLRKIVKEELD